jgi:predicted methyltransferase
VSINSEYIQEVQAKIKSLLRTPQTWNQLLQNSLNTDPCLLWDTLNSLVSNTDVIICDEVQHQSIFSLREMAKHKEIKPRYSKNIHVNSTDSISDWTDNYLINLPKSSSVFSQWWFSPDSYQSLSALALSLLNKKDIPLFLGCPTLGSIFSTTYNRKSVIADIDHEILTYCSKHGNPQCDFIEYDIASPLLKEMLSSFELAWIDPPWSSKLLTMFILRAYQTLKRFGYLVVALPPALTRPTARKELYNIQRFMSDIGLVKRAEFPQLTHYELPEFEKRAYEASGISLTEPWRSGDLFIYQKENNPVINVESYIERLSVPQEKWDQIVHDRDRVFIRRSSRDKSIECTVSLIEGMTQPILGTVSSRNSNWELADIITTKNAVLQCSAPNKIRSYLMKCNYNELKSYLTFIDNDLTRTNPLNPLSIRPNAGN